MPSCPANPTTALRLALVALILLAPVACKSKKDSGPEPVGRDVELNGIDRLVHQTLRDPQRANSVIALISQAEYDLGEINEVFEKRQKKFSKMAVDHKTTGRELDLFLNQWDAEENTYQRQLVNRIYAIKRQLSPAEWAKIAPPLTNSIFAQSDRLNQMVRANANRRPAPATQSYPPNSAAPVSTRPPTPPPPPPPVPSTTTTTPPPSTTTTVPAPPPVPPTTTTTPPPSTAPTNTTFPRSSPSAPPPNTLPPPPNFTRPLEPLPTTTQ
ncbi:MAG: hypothetical protein AAF591_08945 [Verrucomicrobiota bacterium]